MGPSTGQHPGSGAAQAPAGLLPVRPTAAAAANSAADPERALAVAERLAPITPARHTRKARAALPINDRSRGTSISFHSPELAGAAIGLPTGEKLLRFGDRLPRLYAAGVVLFNCIAAHQRSQIRFAVLQVLYAVPRVTPQVCEVRLIPARFRHPRRKSTQHAKSRL